MARTIGRNTTVIQFANVKFYQPNAPESELDCVSTAMERRKLLTSQGRGKPFYGLASKSLEVT
jgi:hypothetical protein